MNGIVDCRFVVIGRMVGEMMVVVFGFWVIFWLIVLFVYWFMVGLFFFLYLSRLCYLSCSFLFVLLRLMVFCG